MDQHLISLCEFGVAPKKPKPVASSDPLDAVMADLNAMRAVLGAQDSGMFDRYNIYMAQMDMDISVIITSSPVTIIVSPVMIIN